MVEQGLEVVRKARKFRRSLRGDNYYADKLADLRADATNCFRELSAGGVGDISTMAEMVETTFSAKKVDWARRREVGRELIFRVRTAREVAPEEGSPEEDDSIIPLSILVNTGRGYLVSVARQMNGCFSRCWYDACAVMMRRLLETSLIEAFEGRGLADKIKNGEGHFLQLSSLVAKALTEPSWNLSRNTQSALPRLRDLGHLSAHSRYYHAQKSDIEKVRQDVRVVVEELLHIAHLLGE